MDSSPTPPTANFTAPATRRVDAVVRLNLALVAGLWVWLAGELWFEWSISDQYGYGLFVPFLTAYLVWLRMEDRPVPQPWGKDGVVLAFLGLTALAQYPIAVLFSANADWRMLAWGEALLALMSTILLIARWGGWPWVRHFLPAVILFLFAVPWPSLLQITLVDHLMTFLATVVTEILNLFGYDAVRQAHLIQVHGVNVSVEEACSGVRSIQSTIMAGWLVGEWWRYGIFGRCGLMGWACVVAVLFNLLRTFSLALMAAASGAEMLERWHDTAGYLVFGVSFATVLLGAWLARPKKKNTALQESASAGIAPPHWLSRGPVIALLVLLAGAWPACIAWYAAHAPDLSQKAGWKLDLIAAAPEAKAEAPQAALRQILFYSDGIFSKWRDASGRDWQLFNFQWANARAAQLGGVHSPESCLPDVGWVKTQQGDNLDWKRNGLELIFNTYEFTTYEFADGPRSVYVFYCQWDPAGYPYFEKTGRYRSDRLLDAWQGNRHEGKQLLEVAISHVTSLTEATQLMRQFLDKAINVLPSSGMKH
ncbi:MAG TPA: exosortase/archaeosortase family protein [Opitutales bacterium]|jgi:exosortase|nr:exosortase/archaeosortase family protein [Opitutales bacterium]